MRKWSLVVERAWGHRTGRVRFGLRLPVFWEHTLTPCIYVCYAAKEHGQFRMEKEKGAEGERTREADRGQTEEGY